MAKFNVVQKRRRALIAEKKRELHGDPSTGKLKIKNQPLSLSGKRKRKLFKRWRREQKDALQKGLVSMEDVQMAVAEGETKDSHRSSGKIHLKKNLKLKQLKRKVFVPDSSSETFPISRIAVPSSNVNHASQVSSNASLRHVSLP